MSTSEFNFIPRRLICRMARVSLTAVAVNVTLSSVIFLITTYAFLLRSTKYEVELSPDSQSSIFGLFKPYLTQGGEFCVLPNAVLADDHSKFSAQDDVTLVTQSSLHYLNSALEQSRLWEGPISFALYLPSWTVVKSVHWTLLAMRYCSSDFRRKVSIHFFYPAKDPSCPVHPPPSLLLNFSDCQSSADNLLRKIVPRNFNALAKTKAYPVNVARNIARRASSTLLTLVADVELMPSSDFVTMFMEFYKFRHKIRAKEAFVVPVFELDFSRPLPRTKDELYEEARKELALPFHSKRIAYECHRIPSLGKWWHSGVANRSRIDVFTSTFWIRPCWEPVFLSLTSETPLYDERFRGYGKNKIQQVCFGAFS